MSYCMKTCSWYLHVCQNRVSIFLHKALNCLWTFQEHQRHHVICTCKIQKYLKFKHIDLEIASTFSYSVYQFNSSCLSISDIKNCYEMLQIMKIWILDLCKEIILKLLIISYDYSRPKLLSHSFLQKRICNS